MSPSEGLRWAVCLVFPAAALVSPPRILQRVLFEPLAAVGMSVGFRGRYPPTRTAVQVKLSRRRASAHRYSLGGKGGRGPAWDYPWRFGLISFMIGPPP